MAITLTENAARHVRKMLEQRPGIGLRLGTRKSGCSGFAYVVDYAQEIGETDQVFESNGVKIVVERASLPLLDGLTVDFGRHNMLNEGFDFLNPNVKQMCGCGESFNV